MVIDDEGGTVAVAKGADFPALAQEGRGVGVLMAQLYPPASAGEGTFHLRGKRGAWDGMRDELEAERIGVDTGTPYVAQHRHATEAERQDFIESVGGDSAERENTVVDSRTELVEIEIAFVARFGDARVDGAEKCVVVASVGYLGDRVERTAYQPVPTVGRLRIAAVEMHASEREAPGHVEMVVKSKTRVKFSGN